MLAPWRAAIERARLVKHLLMLQAQNARRAQRAQTSRIASLPHEPRRRTAVDRSGRSRQQDLHATWRRWRGRRAARADCTDRKSANLPHEPRRRTAAGRSGRNRQQDLHTTWRRWRGRRAARADCTDRKSANQPHELRRRTAAGRSGRSRQQDLHTTWRRRRGRPAAHAAPPLMQPRRSCRLYGSQNREPTLRTPPQDHPRPVPAKAPPGPPYNVARWRLPPARPGQRSKASTKASCTPARCRPSQNRSAGLLCRTAANDRAVPKLAAQRAPAAYPWHAVGLPR